MSKLVRKVGGTLLSSLSVIDSDRCPGASQHFNSVVSVCVMGCFVFCVAQGSAPTETRNTCNKYNMSMSVAFEVVV